MNPEFYRTVCTECGGPFEFPAEGVGLVVLCPHCSALITLRRQTPRLWIRLLIVIALIVPAGLAGLVSLRAVRHSASDREKADTKQVSDDPEFLHQEARQYAYGDGQQKNPAKAAQLWSRAAETGHLKAQLNLGLCYLYGAGVPKDSHRGVEWIQKAAEAHLPEAEFQMGFLLSNGIGVPKNPRTAVDWYLKAAKKGVSQAFVDLGFCYGEGLGVPRSETESTYWYRKAAERGEHIGMLGMAQRLQYGAGTAIDLPEAYKWYLLARASAASNYQYIARNPSGRTSRDDIEKGLAQLNTQLSREQLEDARQRAGRFTPSKQAAGPSQEQELSLELKETSGLLKVTVERVLVGQRAVDYEVFHQFQLDEQRRRGREVVYFQITVQNLSGASAFDLSHFGFTLRDDKGNSYPVEQTRDYLRGKAFPRGNVRGGIAFGVQQECTPVQLIYDPGLVSYVPGLPDIMRQRVLAHTADLVGLEVFSRPLERR